MSALVGGAGGVRGDAGAALSGAATDVSGVGLLSGLMDLVSPVFRRFTTPGLRREVAQNRYRALASLDCHTARRSLGRRPGHSRAGQQGSEPIPKLGAALRAPDEYVRAATIWAERVACGRGE